MVPTEEERLLARVSIFVRGMNASNPHHLGSVRLRNRFSPTICRLSNYSKAKVVGWAIPKSTYSNRRRNTSRRIRICDDYVGMENRRDDVHDSDSMRFL
jgi:hypothetical protein